MAVTMGVIADDFTGATDMASFMVEQGWRVALLTGVPYESHPECEEADAIVISLKSRSLPADEAVRQTLQCYRWLKASHAVRQVYFKYCSTFDSTPEGNIGPVSDALLDAMRVPFIVHCPALPQNGRTVVHGHLFVNGVLLNESGMEKHPLNPMTDANLKRVLSRQTPHPISVIPLRTLQAGTDAMGEALQQCEQQVSKHIIVDTLTDADLKRWAEVLNATPLLAGGSGLGGALAAFATQGDKRALPHGFAQDIRTVIFSGSCSIMTNRQVNAYKRQAAWVQLDVARCIADDEHYLNELSDWALTHIDDPLAPLIYATQPADILAQIKQQYGEQAASHAVERAFSKLALLLRERGVNTFIVAGGETSGTVVEACRITRLSVGKAITPGVPWVFAADQSLSLALKSGNFGQEDFFFKAQEYLA